jgi:hypothetical protein
MIEPLREWLKRIGVEPVEDMAANLEKFGYSSVELLKGEKTKPNQSDLVETCKILLPWAKLISNELSQSGMPILSYPILSYPILSYPILSYPILSS